MFKLPFTRFTPSLDSNTIAHCLQQPACFAEQYQELSVEKKKSALFIHEVSVIVK